MLALCLLQMLSLHQESLLCYAGSFNSGRGSLSVSSQYGFFSSVSGQTTWDCLSYEVSWGRSVVNCEKFPWNLEFDSVFTASFQARYAMPFKLSQSCWPRKLEQEGGGTFSDSLSMEEETQLLLLKLG